MGPLDTGAKYLSIYLSDTDIKFHVYHRTRLFVTCHHYWTSLRVFINCAAYDKETDLVSRSGQGKKSTDTLIFSSFSTHARNTYQSDTSA